MKYIWERENWFDFKYDNAALLKPLSGLRVLQGKLLGRSVRYDLVWPRESDKNN